MAPTLSRIIGIAAIAAASFALAPANAQTSGTATTDRPKNNWAVNCGAGETADSPLVCQMVQNVTVTETNQRLLSVVIRPQPEQTNHMLTLALPHGVDFTKGVEVTIDENETLNLVVNTSTPQGAFANQPISDALLSELRAGSVAKITFYSVAGQAVSVPISLVGFSSAYEKLSAG
ncbi:MAG: invasion associated locus B family protein [Hoeflea sp.]|uniref:invasion associated locus B family protein n=1 Tax=Hoeflea sp. TaxID=1940281 RepID=UPI0032ED51ED